MMSAFLQFNCSMHNETAKKAMESYAGFLQGAFEHYRNLWETYIKLQEKYEQRDAHSSFQTNDSCIKTKDELTPQRQLNYCTVMQENYCSSLLELDTLNIDSINFNYDTSNSRESLHINNKSDSPPKSPVFSRKFSKTGSASAKKFMQLSNSKKTAPVQNSSDMKAGRSIEKVSAKCNQKLEISTTRNVETTLLPNGKILKQSRLVLHPVKSKEKETSLLNINKHKLASIVSKAEQNPMENISVAKTFIATESNIVNTDESSDDIIEVSPTQTNVKSCKVKSRLKLKRKISARRMKKNSPNKDKYYRFGPTAISEIAINNINFALCSSSKHTSIQEEDNKSLVKDSNTVVNALKDKVNINNLSPIKMYSKTDVQVTKPIETQRKNQPIINYEVITNNEVQSITKNTNNFAYGDKTFYLPVEQAANKNKRNNFDLDDFNLNDTENKPPIKKILLDKFDMLPRKQQDNSEQLNMRCKADRAKLDGWDCWECKEYYKNLLLSKEELQKRKNQCSRHRHKYEKSSTPEGFWNPEFPETPSSTYRENKM